MNNYWNCINYKTPVKYFINTYIREYDLSKANINALFYKGRLSKEEYTRYLNMDKLSREKYIGLLIRQDKSIYKDIQDGIIEAKKRLILSNNIQENDIVSIKNDAVFILGNQLPNLLFPPFEFKIKNTYTIFMQLLDLEIYYGEYIDFNTKQINTSIDVKGISDDKLLLHQNGMLDLICEVCYRLQRENINDTIQWICEIYRLFINRELPKQYYRNFDSFSMYIFKTSVNMFGIMDIDQNMIKNIDINRNLNILRNIIGIVSDIYHVTNK